MKEPAILLQGLSSVMHFLLNAEADFICGTAIHTRSKKRLNNRSGLYKRKLRTHLGDIPLRVPHLKYIYPRISMVKRAQRLEAEMLGMLAQIRKQGITPKRVEALIRTVWTVSLPPKLLAMLKQQLTTLLEFWLSQKSNAHAAPVPVPVASDETPFDDLCGII